MHIANINTLHIADINDIRNDLKSICNDLEYREIGKTVHELNSDLHRDLSTGKADKLRRLRDSTPRDDQLPTTNTTKLVVTITSDLELGEHERSLLSKGLSYIPARTHSDEYTAKADCEKFFAVYALKRTLLLILPIPQPQTNHQISLKIPSRV